MSILSNMSENRKKLLIIPAVVVGILIFFLLVQGNRGPQKAPPQERISHVRTIEVPSVELLPRVLAFGTVQPGMVWEGVSQVAGTIVYQHPQLKKGIRLNQGDVLLRIDPVDYELAVVQSKTRIQVIESQLVQSDLKAKNTEFSLAIERRSLEISEKELKRTQNLRNRNLESQGKLDQQERSTMGQRQSVQSLENTLRLIPAERQLLEAQLAEAQAALRSAELSLERTTIVLPFDARIAEVNVELSQYAKQGEILVSADSIDVAEITAQISFDKMSRIFRPDSQISSEEVLRDGMQAFGIEATARFNLGNIPVEWPGRLVRISDTVDTQTRTIGAIVAVEEPYRRAIAGVRPPLIKNMFVEVELRGKPLPSSVVIPRSALHDQKVYVVNGDNRLEIRTVQPGFTQTNFVYIRDGLKAGEKIVTSELNVVIDGMLLETALDDQVMETLIAEAQGKGDVK